MTLEDTLWDMQRGSKIILPENYIIDVAEYWKPLKPTEVFATYWYFASARQDLFLNRLDNKLPWTNDEILSVYRFTNAYRASDRVSQYLIRNVIDNNLDITNNIFRILIYKFFNKIKTWELIEKEMGSISWKNYNYKAFDKILLNAMDRGETIFSAAYIMPSGQTSFGELKKHQNYLRLIEKMMSERLPEKLESGNSLKEIYNIIREYPLMGKFLAFQYAIDINYCDQMCFDEGEFVVAGPGAENGIVKCFSNSGIFSPEQIIKLMYERQELEFNRLGVNFRNLWGRRLQLIDIQNLFCEVDKYSRVAHPSVAGKDNRNRIKQVYRNINPERLPIPYYPPRWGINSYIEINQQ